jgi:hypothetical protein
MLVRHDSSLGPFAPHARGAYRYDSYKEQQVQHPGSAREAAQSGWYIFNRFNHRKKKWTVQGVPAVKKKSGELAGTAGSALYRCTFFFYSFRPVPYSPATARNHRKTPPHGTGNFDPLSVREGSMS